MAKAPTSGIKTITFDEQIARMNDLFGIPKEDALNVFSNYKKTLEVVIGEEADAGTKQFELITPLGGFALDWQNAEERINSADGVAYTAPACYVGEFSYPKWIVETANKNVDFSAIPSSSEIAASKAA